MAGKKCPGCGKATYFTEGHTGKCTSCGYSMHMPINKGVGGKGKKCPHCGKQTLHAGTCSNCGATT